MKSYHMSNKYMRVFWWNTSSSTYVSVQKYILTKVDARHMWELSWKINWGYEASLPVLRQVDAVVPQNQHAHQDQHLQVTAHAHLQGSTSKRFKRKCAHFVVFVYLHTCICIYCLRAWCPQHLHTDLESIASRRHEARALTNLDWAQWFSVRAFGLQSTCQ